MKTALNTPILLFALVVMTLSPRSTVAQDEKTEVKQPLRVAASFASTRGHYRIWADAFEKQIEELGAVSVTISAIEDVETQEAHCDYLIDQNIGALALLPVDMASATGIVARARARGIPVLALEHMINNCALDLLFAIDLKAGGFNQVDTIVKNNIGGYVLLGDTATQDALVPLQEGRLNALTAQITRKRVQLVGHEWMHPATVESSNRALTELMAEKGPPNVVLVTHPDQAAGAILALKRIGAEDHCRVSGFQPDFDECTRIQLGQQHSSLYVSYPDAGRRSAKLLYMMATQQTIAIDETRHNGSMEVPVSLFAPILITQDNVEEIMTRDGVFKKIQP